MTLLIPLPYRAFFNDCARVPCIRCTIDYTYPRQTIVCQTRCGLFTSSQIHIHKHALCGLLYRQACRLKLTTFDSIQIKKTILCTNAYLAVTLQNGYRMFAGEMIYLKFVQLFDKYSIAKLDHCTRARRIGAYTRTIVVIVENPQEAAEHLHYGYKLTIVPPALFPIR